MRLTKETLLLDYINNKSIHTQITERRSTKMKTLLITLALSLMVLSVVPSVLAVSIGSSVTPNIVTEEFPPMVWMCGDRIVEDDNTEPGRVSSGGKTLVERINNYAFEGESIQWTVLVMDKNGIQKVKDVYGTVGTTQGAGNDIEVNCVRSTESPSEIPSACNARIDEEHLTSFDSRTMAFYTCQLTVETAESMAGEHWITVEAEDMGGLKGTMAENEYWFFNPVVALSIDGDMTFDHVRPGTDSYSSTMLIGNDAEAGSGVMMDMFISGTDFYDSSSSGAACPDTNQLSLDAFRYFATNGAYSSLGDDGVGRPSPKDAESYVAIGYGSFADTGSTSNSFYDSHEILQDQHIGPTPHGYYTANILAPGAEMALTFKLSLPEPCNGNFDTGSIWFWGEAI